MNQSDISRGIRQNRQNTNDMKPFQGSKRKSLVSQLKNEVIARTKMKFLSHMPRIKPCSPLPFQNCPRNLTLVELPRLEPTDHLIQLKSMIFDPL